jgi:putative transposase
MLREWLRQRLGRAPPPSAGSRDRQSVKTSGVGGPGGCDSGKPLTGRQRHLLVDTEGLVLRAVVPPANSRDREGVKVGLHAAIRADLPRRRHVWRDSADHGQGQGQDGSEQTLGWSAQIVAPPPRSTKVWVPKDIPPEQIDWSQELPPPGFRGLPRRWVVERTFAWQGQQRRLSKD